MNSEAEDLLRAIAADSRTEATPLQLIWEAGLCRPEILRHPNCPPAALALVAGAALDSSQEPSLDALAAFRHPMCPEAFLLRAVRSRRPELVAAAAACPDLPAELAAEIEGAVWLDPKDLLGAARMEEAKKLARLGWNVRQEAGA